MNESKHNPPFFSLSNFLKIYSPHRPFRLKKDLKISFVITPSFDLDDKSSNMRSSRYSSFQLTAYRHRYNPRRVWLPFDSCSDPFP